ncbi:MAG: heme exporter protein CcmB [Pseudomonadota bacterium]
MSSTVMLAVLRRDLQLASRRPVDALLPLVFFLVAGSLFPLGVGPEMETLRTIAPGIVWVCALLSSMLSLPAMYGGDHADGSLEQMLLSPQSAILLAGTKACAHWMLTGLPLVMVAPLFGLMFDMQFTSISMLSLSLMIGTPILSLVGGIGAALTLGLRHGAVLILLIVLPLCVPVLIFGAGAVSAVSVGLDPGGHLSLLAALLLLSLVGAPLVTASALKISI